MGVSSRLLALMISTGCSHSRGLRTTRRIPSPGRFFRAQDATDFSFRDRFRISFSFAFLIVLLLLGPMTLSAQEADLAIVGGMLIDGNEGPPLENAVVLVEGEEIVHVGTVADTEIPSGAEVVDANGYTVMPGLNDAHVHLMIVGHGIYDEFFPKYDDRFEEITPISAQELLYAGVTSARDLGMPLDDALWSKEQIETGEVEGPRLFVAGPFLQASLPPGEGTSYDSEAQSSFRWTVDGAEDAREKTRRLIDGGVDLIKVIQLSQLTEAERQAIAAEAHEAGLHIAVHASSLSEVRLAAEMGASSIEHAGAGKNPRYDEERIRLMTDHDITASPTSVVSRILDITLQFPERLDDPQLEEDLPPELYRDVRESLEFFTRLDYFDGDSNDSGHHAEKVKQLYEGGVQLVIGTDSGTPMNFHYESTWQEMDLFVRYGIPPMKVIAMATRIPAQLYGVGDTLGTIEPGKLADIIVVDGNPLRHMSALQQNNVVHVIKDGIQYK